MAIKIFIDQGHNPSGTFNSGAEANGLQESEINFQVGLYLQNLLNSDPRFEARVSRPEPDTVLGTNNTTSLAARVAAANQWPADYFISIHSNLNPNPEINGTEVYIYQYFTQAQWLAEQIMSGINDMVGTRNNGIRENPSLYVLRNADMPANLVELGYLSNYSDAEKLRNDQYGFAYGIYLGLLRYFGFA
ncbi:N-acetylmuramoyl-L-alanine amidase family protein [Lacrimispora amygdalina]|uniref:N-acetylmuramoyl-L-alanine amidase family protein n=1 Tax=Lacrimispora amygdalina TaxID=253257 RepID=UPI000BE3987B|nr:N-acetylmuramoyl-L-alanine amidase [Lacrimispora amygdalina]